MPKWGSNSRPWDQESHTLPTEQIGRPCCRFFFNDFYQIKKVFFYSYFAEYVGFNVIIGFWILSNHFLYVLEWYSVGGDVTLYRVLGNVWRHFWLSQLGGCHWHLAGGARYSLGHTGQLPTERMIWLRRLRRHAHILFLFYSVNETELQWLIFQY